ncbi:MAG: cobalamin B12-binding domain-containing protein [Candidatus Rokubacteria bacterium]|nr:cobalamin B12-binding domain-containing protein [Candidatus Rokubacteria bacterium]
MRSDGDPARAPRVLLAKPGLDGHDLGIKIVAGALKEAGIEVIYTGLCVTPQEVVEMAVQEDVDVVGLGIMSGSHFTIVPKVIGGLGARGAGNVRVIVGGIIPKGDIPRLRALGVTAVFLPGTDVADVVRFVREGASG